MYHPVKTISMGMTLREIKYNKNNTKNKDMETTWRLYHGWL